MPANTKIQLRRGTASSWTSTNPTLAAGEIGFETDTGKFKIGKDGLTAWNSLPYAGGSQILPGSGVSTRYDSNNNAYTIHTPILTSGNGVSLNQITIIADGTTIPSGSGYRLSLSDRLQAVSNLSTSGIIVSTGTSGVTTRSLASGSNIFISNADGINNNPLIGLNTSLTGLNSISGTNNFTIATISGINIQTHSGTVNVNDLTVGNLNVNQNINISLAAAMLATGPIRFSGNPVIFSGTTYFDTTPYVGPTGGTLGSNLFPVSLSGHVHSTGDITNFCGGVASCVNTELVTTSGISATYNGTNALTLSLSGQALAIHNLNTNGLVARSGANTFVSRTISASGTNIWIGNGDGTNGNPSVGLSPDISVSSVTANDITVNNNLVVNGTTVIANVDAIVVEDPIMTLGKSSGTIVANTSYDRGVALVLNTGLTAFMGWDTSASKFVVFSSGNADSVSGTYTPGTWGTFRAGDLEVDNATANTIALFNSDKKLTSFATGNFVPANRKITPGSGLDGTDALVLSGDITLNIGAGDGISVSSDTVGVNSTFIRTTGTQNISGVKTFFNPIVFSSGITTTGIAAKIDTTVSTATHFPAFISNPTTNAQTLYVRTTGDLRSDLSINNVTNDAQVKKRASSTSGYVPTWNGTTGDALNDGYLATSEGANGSLVLRNNTGAFSASNITSSGTVTAYSFAGSGNALTDINAYNLTIYSNTNTDNLASLVLVTGNSTGNYRPFIDSKLYYNANTNVLAIENMSGLLTWSTYPTYTSTSISGINNTTYLVNFIVDGGTP